MCAMSTSPVALRVERFSVVASRLVPSARAGVGYPRLLEDGKEVDWI